MADGRRNWQRWLDQMMDSLGAMSLYDPEFAWDPATLVTDPNVPRHGAVAVTQKTRAKLRLHSSRNFSSEDGPTAA